MSNIQSIGSCSRFLIAVGLLALSVAKAQNPVAELQTRNLTVLEGNTNIDVVDARPMSATIQLLAERHPMDVTYEDPRFVFQSDTLDLATGRPDTQWLVPKVESLNMQLPLDVGAASDEEWVAALREAVNAYSRASVTARFRVEDRSGVIHVIPDSHRSVTGAMEPQAALLDTLITIPRQEMNGYEMIRAICAALSIAVDGSYDPVGTLDNLVKPMRLPLNTLINFEGEWEANNEPARDVFMRVLMDIDEESAWQLFVTFDPNFQSYWVNVRGIARKPRAPMATEPLGNRPPQVISPEDSIFLTPEGVRRIQESSSEGAATE